MKIVPLVKRTICEIMDINPQDLTLSSTFEEDLDMDDLEIEEVLMELEDALELDLVLFCDISEMKTVGDLVRFIDEQASF